MTNHFTKFSIDPDRRRPHDHAPTPLELQRWEDDGGAVPPDRHSRHSVRHRPVMPQELAAAE